MSELALSLACAALALAAGLAGALAWKLAPGWIARLVGQATATHSWVSVAATGTATGAGATPARRLAWPAWLVRLGRACARLASPAARRLPIRLRAWVARALARAGLDDRWSVDDWLGGQLAWLAASLGAGVVLGGAGPLAGSPLACLVVAASGLLPLRRLAQRASRRAAALEREWPTWLGLVALGLEAGTSFPTALQRASLHAPPGPLREEFARVLGEIRAGVPRREALGRLAERLALPGVSATVAALSQAESSGLGLAPVLHAQALRATQERFARAEKRALEAPVKMLGPLLLCIFPCTFIVVGFPIAAVLFWGA